MVHKREQKTVAQVDTKLPYKVKDISQADFGRREIKLAETGVVPEVVTTRHDSNA